MEETTEKSFESLKNPEVEKEYEQQSLGQFLWAAFCICVDDLRIRFLKTFESLKNRFFI